MLILGKPRSINMINEFVNSYQIPDRSSVKILIIDNENVPSLERLRRNDFSIKHLKNCNDVSAVSEYEIILVDIFGVATELSETYQGAFLISEIRKKYPSKVIIGFSSQTYSAAFDKYCRMADSFYIKDLDAENWLENLDEAIKLCVNPEYQWKKLRDHLLSINVPIFNVMQLEDNFVDVIQTKKGSFPDKKRLDNLNSDIKAILQSFAASLLFKIIFGI